MVYHVLLTVMIFFIIYCTFFESYVSEGSNDRKYVNSMRNGIIRGVLGGLITGNYENMVTNAVSLGLLNPALKFIE